MNIGGKYLIQILLSNLWDIYTEVRFLEHIVILVLSFEELPYSFYSGSPILYFHQQCTWVNSPHAH